MQEDFFARQRQAKEPLAKLGVGKTEVRYALRNSKVEFAQPVCWFVFRVSVSSSAKRSFLCALLQPKPAGG
jgi:hypothetical protein